MVLTEPVDPRNDCLMKFQLFTAGKNSIQIGMYNLMYLLFMHWLKAFRGEGLSLKLVNQPFLWIAFHGS